MSPIKCILSLVMTATQLSKNDTLDIFQLFMMTSSNGNIFRVPGLLCGEFTGHHKGQWREALMFSLICACINGSVNNREAGDLRRHRGHYDVTVMLRAHSNDSMYIIHIYIYNEVWYIRSLSLSALVRQWRGVREKTRRNICINKGMHH